jgi:hypothetical protein
MLQRPAMFPEAITRDQRGQVWYIYNIVAVQFVVLASYSPFPISRYISQRNFCAQQAACSLQPATIINTTMRDACCLLPTARHDIHWYGPCASSHGGWQLGNRKPNTLDELDAGRKCSPCAIWWLAYLFLAYCGLCRP